MTVVAEPSGLGVDPGGTEPADSDDAPTEMWCALERRTTAEAILPGAIVRSSVTCQHSRPVSGRRVRSSCAGQAPPSRSRPPRIR